MKDILPIWSSHYSLADSILTLEEAGKTKKGNPVSICDLAKDNGLKQVVLIDKKLDGFIEAYKNLSKAGIQLIFGLKLCVCADMNDKTDESLKTESNVIVFLKNSQAYGELIRISNRSWTDGFYYQGRADWTLLKAFWTDNLSLSLPFFSSFIAKNQLSFSNIVPDFPVRPTLMREVDSGLPFAPILDRAVDQFAGEQGLEVQAVKSIYYSASEDFEAYQVFRAIHNRSEFAAPNVNHLCSDQFSFRAYQKLVGGAA